MEQKDKIDQTELREIQEKDFEEQRHEQIQNLEDDLQMRKWMTEPEAKKMWSDINKDMTTGNLSQREIESINMWEQAKLALIAMRNSVPVYAAKILYPDHLEDIIKRRTSQILALSLSRDGFLRTMEASKIIRRDVSINSPSQNVQRGNPARNEKELEWGDLPAVSYFNSRKRKRV